MKSFILAATAVTAVAGHSLLELGVDVDVSDVINLGVGLDLHLPQGIALPAKAENKPSSGPPTGYVNVWHPGHSGVVIDSCDDESADSWHWVHPCGENCKPEQPSQVWTTSTVSVTSIHTVISCAPTITNCPANGHHTTVTTVVIPETTTICPVEASKTKTADYTATPSTAAYPPPAVSSPAYSAPLPTNTAVVTLSTQTAPAYTVPAYTAPVYTVPVYTAPVSTGPASGPYGVPSGPAGYPAPSNSAPAYSVPPAESSPAVPTGAASSPHYPAPVASSVPAYPVPCNSSAPAYTPPSTSVYSPPVQSSVVYSVPPTAPSSPAGGCTGAYCVPPPAGTSPAPAPPAPTGNSTTPPPVNGAVGRTQGVSVALFAGVIAALFL